MSKVYFKNLVGLHCSDFELLQVPCPRLEYGLHVTLKTVQCGTLAGSLLGPLMYVLANGASNRAGLRQSAINGGLYGAGIGLMAGPVLSLGYYNHSLSKVSNYDQCYRLRYHGAQLSTDRLSLLGGLIGGALGGGAGMVIGVDVGVLCGLLLNGTRSIRLQI